MLFQVLEERRRANAGDPLKTRDNSQKQLITTHFQLVCLRSFQTISFHSAFPVRYGTYWGITADAAEANSIAACSASASELLIGTVTRTIAPSERRTRTLSSTV